MLALFNLQIIINFIFGFNQQQEPKGNPIFLGPKKPTMIPGSSINITISCGGESKKKAEVKA